MAVRHTFLADAVIGAHGEFAELVFAITRELAAAAGRVIDVIDRFTPVDFLTHPRPILLSNYPSNQLVAAIDRGDVRVLYFSEPPGLTLSFMDQRLGVPPMESIRSQTASAVANLAISRSPYARVLQRDAVRSLRQMVDTIAGHLELALADEVREAIAGEVSKGQGPSAPVESVLEIVSPPTPAVHEAGGARPMSQVSEEILNPLIAMARFGPMRPVVWPHEVFTFHDNPNALPPREAAIAGPSRNLFYGPYFFLPPARYRVETFLVFSEEISIVPFVLEVHAGNWLARARIDQRSPGQFRGTFELDHYDATSPIEIRLRNDQPVDRGRLSLVEILFFGEPEPR